MTDTPKKRPRSWWYPWIFVGGMSLVIVVNGTLAYFAVDSWTGIATQNHYTKGLNFDTNIEGAKRQAALGWTVKPELDFAPIGLDKSRAAALTVTASDRHNQPLDALSIRVKMVRPTHEGFDQTVTLQGQGNGQYAADVTLPLPGLWEMRVIAQNGEDAFQLQHRIQTP